MSKSRRGTPGPPSRETDSQDIHQLLGALSLAERVSCFRILREEFPIHPLEREWNTSAEAVLEAISRSSDLTQRGIRGVLAEASFRQLALPQLASIGFEDVTPAGDIPYDVGIRDAAGDVRIQVKLQRRRGGQPMTGNQATRILGFSERCFVVETQKTRGGTKKGEATRPYRFGEFDILAVSMAPSTGRWDRFLCTVASWLLPDSSNPRQICKYQPVPPAPNVDWTDDMLTCIGWFRNAAPRTISTNP
jgi:hypothetical protein